MRAQARRAVVAVTLSGLALLGSACGGGAQPIARIDWREGGSAAGSISGDALAVQAASTGGVFPLTVIEDPGVGGEGYVVRGRVRYDGVEGQGFLEMWSVFPDGGRYYSRTLAEQGPQGRLSGSSDWRPFELPFHLDGGPPPERLEIGIVLPGSGTVEIGPLELVPLEASQGAWWSDRTGGLVGGIVGSAIGILGAILGWLVFRRRARTFTLGAMRSAVAAGALLLCVGAVAVATSQPYGVAYPILLAGVILVGVFGGSLRGAKRAYADHELRRIRALDQA